MSTEYVVVVETPMGSAFLTERGLSSEYPNAKLFPHLKAAKAAAAGWDKPLIYTAAGYAQGKRPVRT